MWILGSLAAIVSLVLGVITEIGVSRLFGMDLSTVQFPADAIGLLVSSIAGVLLAHEVDAACKAGYTDRQIVGGITGLPKKIFDSPDSVFLFFGALLSSLMFASISGGIIYGLVRLWQLDQRIFGPVQVLVTFFGGPFAAILFVASIAELYCTLMEGGRRTLADEPCVKRAATYLRAHLSRVLFILLFSAIAIPTCSRGIDCCFKYRAAGTAGYSAGAAGQLRDSNPYIKESGYPGKWYRDVWFGEHLRGKAGLIN